MSQYINTFAHCLSSDVITPPIFQAQCLDYFAQCFKLRFHYASPTPFINA